MIRTKTSMTLSHFHDFYFLQALQAEINSELARTPEFVFKRSVEKLQIDLHDTLEDMVENMALRVFVYLYAACLGESRHARSSQAQERFIPETIGRHRAQLFAEISDYAPTKQNLQTLVSIFDQKWHSGYGGNAWKQIAEALLDYDKMNKIAWLDHVVDLEHNNGTAFNKSDAGTTIQFETTYPLSFSSFLDYKFAKNILAQTFKDKYGDVQTLGITRKTHSLIQRWSTIFGKKMPWWVRPSLDTLTEYDIEWGDKSIRAQEKWLSWVDVNSGNEPDAGKVMAYLRLETKYSPQYTRKELKKFATSAKKAASKSAGKFYGQIKKDVLSQIAKWYEQAKKDCKPQKCKVTYSILPLKATGIQDDGLFKIRFFIPYPYQGIGKRVRGGFEIVKSLAQLSGFNSELISTLTNGGCLDGHLFHKYGTTVVQLDNNQLMMNDKKLEALLD